MLVYYILFIRVTRFCVVFSHLSLLAVKNIMTLRLLTAKNRPFFSDGISDEVKNFMSIVPHADFSA